MPDRSSRRLRAGRRLSVLALGALAAAGPTPALAQVDYTGLPASPPPTDTYVATYVGPPTGGTSAPTRPAEAPTPGALRGTVSVTDPALGAAATEDQGAGRLVTGWDLVTVAALGLTAVVAFAVSAARLRSS